MPVFDASGSHHEQRGAGRFFASAVFTAITLTAVSFVWYIAYRDTCATVASWKFCEFSKHLFERAIGVFVLCALLAAARPLDLRRLIDASRSSRTSRTAGWLALAGAFLLCLPLARWGLAPAGSALLASVALWAAAVAVLALAALRLAAPWSAWLRFVRSNRVWFGVLFLLGLALPDLGDMLFPLWHMDNIKEATFSAVQTLAQAVGLTLAADPLAYTIGQGEFWVEVGQSCSGIEGFALLTVFLLGYAILFRQQLVPLRVVAILPFALALSWCLNVIRITVLIWIGVNVSPTLAVEGFHSHAGWLIFTSLSLGLIGVMHKMDWFQREHLPQAHQVLPPLVQDWTAARILPFAVFMFTAVLSSTFLQDPALAYPLRMIGMVAVLWFFRAHIVALAWRMDPVALGLGVIVGVAWVVFAPTVSEPETSFGPGTLGGGFIVLWIVMRVIGTSLIVPITEELFFRSYLLERLGAGRSVALTLVAVTVSTTAFALLHDRIILAAIAGAVFAWLALRPQGRLTDAVVAHVAANVLVAAWALAKSDATII